MTAAHFFDIRPVLNRLVEREQKAGLSWTCLVRYKICHFDNPLSRTTTSLLLSSLNAFYAVPDRFRLKEIYSFKTFIKRIMIHH